MQQEVLHKRIARLESELDLLQTELVFVNDKLKECGFPEGIATLKETMDELLKEGPFISQERPGNSDFEL